MTRHFFLTLIIFSASSLFAQVKLTTILMIDEDGLGAMNMLQVDRAESEKSYFDYIINKDGLNSIDTILAQDYQLIPKENNDIIRFYDKTFIIGDFYFFSKKNLKVNLDTTVFKLTNKHRVTNKSKGLSVTNNKSTIAILITVPNGFEITKVNTTPSSVDVYREKKVVTFSGDDVKRMIYEIEYKKVKVDTVYSLRGKKEILRKEIPIEKKMYQIEIWDDEKEDGDIINVYFNHKLVIHEYKVYKKPLQIPLDLTNAKKEKLVLHFESVSEGEIKPNTVFFRVYGNGLDRTINLTTDEEINSVVEFKINHKK
jgi:hypothetical protein